MRSESDSFTQDLGLRKAGGRNHLFTTNCIWNRNNHNNIALIWMCQVTFKIETHFGKRDTARDQILAESCGEISVLIWDVLVLPFFAPFTQNIITIHIHEHDSSPSKYCFTKNELVYLGEKVSLVSLKMICLIVPSNHCIAEFHQLLRISEETRFGQSEWI